MKQLVSLLIAGGIAIGASGAIAQNSMGTDAMGKESMSKSMHKGKKSEQM